MAQIKLDDPFAAIKGKISGKPSNGCLTVTRQKCYGTDINGEPVYGPKETYAYHLYEGEWTEGAIKNRQLFQQAQKEARAQLSDPDRHAYWQQLFNEHRQMSDRALAAANPPSKRYSTLLGFTVAQIRKQLKNNQ
ncbi:MAG: hypothetical protein MSS82_04715 [Bacteroidales bacterium]|nr:hypothetical protein [Bacteroidales bacterium]